MLLNSQDCIGRYSALFLENEYIALQWLNRRWWEIRKVPNPENVAEHSISAALMVTNRFRTQFEKLSLDLLSMQDTLLIHDIQEPVPWVGDITPHDNICPKDKKIREWEAIHAILWNKPTLLWLWSDYENGNTLEWRMAMELDKLQAIEQARSYENQYNIPWLTEEFYTYAVITKGQIKTQFLLDYAHELMGNTTP